MIQKINVLVTGCGGDIGQSIGKILSEYNKANKLYGCDISDKNAAKFIYKKFFISIKCTDKNYISFLLEHVERKDIHIIIPASEPELRYYEAHKDLTHIGKALIIKASQKALTIGFNKYLTSRFLEENNFPFPLTYKLKELPTTISFPLILKSSTSSGSKQIFKVEDIHELDFFMKKYGNFIIQEYLEDSQGEFTCGVYRHSNDTVRIIILKRILMGGFSGYGEVIRNKEIEELLISLSEALDLKGSINVQLRLTDKGPVIFEINPRFSSTVRFRDLFGFKDLIWSIEDALNLPLSEYKPVEEGNTFYKGFNEFIEIKNEKINR